MSAYLRIVRSFGRDIRLFFLFFAMIGVGFFGISAVLLNLYVLRLGYGIPFLGILAGAGLLAFAASSLPAGTLGSRFGSRRSMISGIAVSTLAMALFLLADSLPARFQAAWLIGTQLVFWAGAGIIVVNYPPFLMERLPAEERGHGFAVAFAIQMLTGFAGSLVAGLLPGAFARLAGTSLAAPDPYRLALWTAVVCFAIGMLAMLATRAGDGGGQAEPERNTESAADLPDARPPYRLIAVMAAILLLTSTAYPAANTFFTAYLDTALRAPASLIGLLVALARLLSVPANLAAPLLLTRWGLQRTFALSTLALLVALLPLALIPAWGPAGLAFMVLSAASAISSLAVTVFHQALVRPEWRSTMSGAANTTSALSQAAAAFGGGFLIAAAGFATFLLGAGAVTLAGVVLFWWYFRAPRGAADAAPVPIAPVAGEASVPGGH